MLTAELIGSRTLRLPNGHEVEERCIKLDPCDPIAWLRAERRTDPWLFWTDRRRNERVAAFDPIWTGPLPRALADGVRVYGGVRFDQGRGETAEEWSAFGNSQFMLPRYELRQTDTQCLLFVRDSERSPTDLEARELQAPQCTGTHREPLRVRWDAMIAHAKALFSSGKRRKVVLARRETLRLDREEDALDLFAQLHKPDGNCFDFAYSPDGTSCFFGSSPERLFELKQGAVRTEAVAGTCPGSDDPQQAEAFGKVLLSSEKDQHEHAIVVESICAALQDVCEDIRLDAPTGLLQRRLWQHLWTPISAVVKRYVRPPDLIRALHPTPAVGGQPREGIEEEIRTLEHFDRGWYAGAIGWMEDDNAEFSVAIRSALLEGQNLHTYAGAGIVPASHPATEWEETETKLMGMRSLCQS